MPNPHPAPQHVSPRGVNLPRRMESSCATASARTPVRCPASLTPQTARHHGKHWGLAVHGYGSQLNHQGTAGFSPWFHLPGFHLGHLFLTHSHRLSQTSSLFLLAEFEREATPRKKTHGFTGQLFLFMPTKGIESMRKDLVWGYATRYIWVAWYKPLAKPPAPAQQRPPSQRSGHPGGKET